MKHIVVTLLLLILTPSLLLASCASGDWETYEIDVSVDRNPSIVGNWHQNYAYSAAEEVTGVSFSNDGTGNLMRYVANSNSLDCWEPVTFNYALTERHKLTITYDDGNQDVLHLSDWRKGMVVVQVEDYSKWFVDGIMVRVDD